METALLIAILVLLAFDIWISMARLREAKRYNDERYRILRASYVVEEGVDEDE